MMQSLASFIRENKGTIVYEWISWTRRIPTADGMSADAIRNHIPEFLDRLADAVEHDDVPPHELSNLPNLHAMMRLRRGYDLREVFAEYRMLRRVIMEQYTSRAGELSEESRPHLIPLALMHETIDRAVGDAVEEYARERDHARETIMGILGHDLREPLNAIVFGAQTLARGEPGGDGSLDRTVSLIASSARRMEALISDLLDFARARPGGGIPVTPTPLDAGSLVRQAIEEISQGHPDRLIRLEAVPGPPGCLVTWDGARVSQAIFNLLSNAMAHGRDPIVVQVAPGDEEVLLQVRNGGEIPADTLPHLFEPFFRRRAPGRHGGLGLGLYIVQEIARAHGGRVEAASEGGQTSFDLVLPRHASGNSPPAGGQPGGAGPGTPGA